MIATPAGTPPQIIGKLHSDLKSIASMPEIQQQFVRIGLIPVDSPPPDKLQQFVGSEIVRWSKVVDQAGLTGMQ